MATTIDECRQICQLVKETGLKYMMAETVVYSREFLYILYIWLKKWYRIREQIFHFMSFQAHHPDPAPLAPDQ